MTRDKIVFFEQIDSVSYPLTNKYLNKDFKIYFFNIEDKYKGKQKTKKYLEAGKLIDISQMVFEFIPVCRQAMFYAHENVDYIFDKYFSSSASIRNMGKLLESSQIENMYKYRLLRALENVYIAELKINDIAQDSSDEILFYPSSYFKIYSDKTSLLLKNIRVINNTSFTNSLKVILTRLRKSLSFSGPVFLFLKKVRGITRSKKAKGFRVGISVNFPQNIFSMNYFLMETLLIDDEELPKEEALFIDERGQSPGFLPQIAGSSPPNSKDYEKRGYNYTNLPDDRETISSDLFWRKIIRRFLPAWLKAMATSFREETLIIDTTLLILSEYIKWNIFVDNYKIDNYVRILNPDPISRTHILSQYNIKTWFIYPDNSSSDYRLDWDETKKNHTFHSFMSYDNMVIYGDIMERFLKKHRNNVKKYIKVGVLYSQTVRELQEGKLASPISTLIQRRNLPKKRIGVFDTTFADYGALKIKEGIHFGNDILKLLDEMPDIGIIFKAKKWPGRVPELDPIYDKLSNHERCLLFYMWNKDGISATEVIAESDLVISATYISPSAEALGAKVKAIYYDVSATEIGGKYYFNRYPNFVAHSYEELKKLIHYWLYEVTDKDFGDFLNNHVKDEIDPYLDGKALTRLRRLLRE